MDFTINSGGATWLSRSGRVRGTSDPVLFKSVSAEMTTVSGRHLEYLQIDDDTTWEGHTIDNGTVTTDYVDFQNQFNAAIKASL